MKGPKALGAYIHTHIPPASAWSMLGVWRNLQSPHRNRKRKTKQPKTEQPSIAFLWCPVKCHTTQREKSAHNRRKNYSKIILASTVFAPFGYAMTGLRSSSFISGCSMTSLETFSRIVWRASMSAGFVPR